MPHIYANYDDNWSNCFRYYDGIMAKINLYKLCKKPFKVLSQEIRRFLPRILELLRISMEP